LKNILTIDVEDWYQTQDLNFCASTWDNYEDRIEVGVVKILDLLSKYKVTATFFVLGCIAQKHPALIKKIADQGHEIGSHGMSHNMVNQMSPEEFRKDLLDSKKILKDCTGKEINIYRSPCWSISEKNLWALQVLDEEGYICDSSIQPFVTPLSGYRRAPLEPFHPIVDKKVLNIIEVPSTVVKFGPLKIPFAGGFYFRFTPSPLIHFALNYVNKTRVGIIYIHPWELDVEQPRLKTSALVKLSHYYNLKTTYNKLESLLNSFEFVSIGKYLEDKTIPSFNL
jgi:polysaccharide deacetylase family protein (PEP-CTERM system associated)